MLYTYDQTFTTGSGRLIFVPIAYSRREGGVLRSRILHGWSPPDHFFHFMEGGHVAAARTHLENSSFVRLDLHKFYDSITRTKVHRALRSIGFRQKEAWHFACVSTVNKNKVLRCYSLPFGFVQSPILSSLVLFNSEIGKSLSNLRKGGIAVSVYMDDIVLSNNDDLSLESAKHTLELAAESSGFRFNISKSLGPVSELEVFNLHLSFRKLAVSATRMKEFAAAIAGGEPATIGGILGYVGTVNSDQKAALALL